MDDPDAKDFKDHLKEALETDLSDIERTGCVSHGRDLKNNHIVIMIPSLGFKNNEKPEHIFRKMLLLFIRKANEMVGDAYSIVYAHTSIDIINQYPLIYKFYSILPRTYKKNLQKMYIIHPNYGIKMFFEFARVFLSHKFYSKLCLLESIFEFQKIIPPTIIALPLKFLRKEDEDKELKYCGMMAPLSDSFDPLIGTTKIIDVCTTFIKLHGGLRQCGIFRVPGDEGELNLAKVRLQYSNIGGASHIMLSENKDYILVGDLEGLLKTRNGGSTPLTEGKKKNDNNSDNDTSVVEDFPSSIVIIKNINTVAQILKMSIRDLPEPLIPNSSYQQLIDTTRRFEAVGLNGDWEAIVCSSLSTLPHHHISTLIFIITFLREIVSENLVNSMDSNNVAIVFAPSIFRPEMIDPVKAIMEVRLSQIIVRELIDRKSILYEVMRSFKNNESGKLSEWELNAINANPVMSVFALQSLRPEARIPESVDDSTDLHIRAPFVDLRMEDLSQSLSPSMISRMTKGNGRDDATNRRSV